MRVEKLACSQFNRLQRTRKKRKQDRNAGNGIVLSYKPKSIMPVEKNNNYATMLFIGCFHHMITQLKVKKIN